MKKYDINGLPEVVINALESLQSKNISQDDSDDEENPIYEVQRGLRKLYEICIACCKSDSRIVSQHPLFVGGLCVLCTKTVYKVCSLPFGQAQDYCILCGLGGKLVYCSNSLCVRAYCNVCIDYLAPEGAYSQIVQNDAWVCYLCKSDPDRSCLIKRRKNYETIMYTPPQPPKEKLPICVISQSDICHKVLMKEKIIIEKYCIQPCNDAGSCEHTKYSEKYEDFSEKEFADIGADLVYGSYVSNGNLEDRKACVADLFVAFFRFIFRLDNARLHKPYVFFIFIANASIMDEEILTRAKRFVM
ncbi:DNA (cytosine-5)-methyltransferase 3-like, partial [Stegodyphus dumicola]|uniref:DNA (cytosine-5)-methyltransferase 3-like n=1 Tax=Stegodyphus dumicola TaxID=202533 RepID=UPI0015ADBF6B